MFIDINLLDDEFTIIWDLHKCPIEKVLSRIEKELEWESSNVAIKTKIIKQQNQRRGCLLLTLKKKDQAILQNPSASFMVKSRRNNGVKGQNARLCSRDGREEEEEDDCSLLCCRLITVGSWLEPTVIEPNHCRFVAWIGSAEWPPKHCRFKPQTGSDEVLHCRF